MEFNDDNNKNTKNTNDDMNYYDNYAVVCYPSYNNNQLGKGLVTVPGKISELVYACHINEDNLYILSKKKNNNKKE